MTPIAVAHALLPGLEGYAARARVSGRDKLLLTAQVGGVVGDWERRRALTQVAAVRLQQQTAAPERLRPSTTRPERQEDG